MTTYDILGICYPETNTGSETKQESRPKSMEEIFRDSVKKVIYDLLKRRELKIVPVVGGDACGGRWIDSIEVYMDDVKVVHLKRRETELLKEIKERRHRNRQSLPPISTRVCYNDVNDRY